MLSTIETALRKVALAPNTGAEKSNGIQEASEGGEQKALSFVRLMKSHLGDSSRGAIDMLIAATGKQNPYTGIIEEADSAMRDFNTDYREAIDSVGENYANVWQDLGKKAAMFMLSDYQAMVDTLDFLSAPNNIRSNAEIVAFFRDLAISDNQARRNGEEGFTAHIRIGWQNRLRDEINPVVFERFWEDATKPGKSGALIEPILFGLRLAGVKKLTARDVQFSISRIPLDTWPKWLKDAYFSFARNDAAILAAAIHTKLSEVFPDNQRKTVIHAEVGGNGSSKRRSSEAKQQIYPSPDSGGQNSDLETEEHRLKLGLLKTDAGRGNETHYVISIEDEDVESQIASLASVGATPQMVDDLKKILGKMMNSSIACGPAAHRILGGTDHVIVDSKELPLSRIDPKRIPDITFSDPQTRQARITFALAGAGDRLLIHRVFPTHDDYETALGKKTS
jgi:hypothetical protein